MKLKIMDYSQLRVPAFSLDVYLDILSDESEMNRKLCEFYKNPLALDALCYMAPSYFRRVKEKLSTGIIEADDEETLLKYASRFCYRPTPLGYSSTVSALHTKNAELPTIEDKSLFSLDCHLDEYVAHLLKVQVISFESAQHALFKLNDTIYSVNDELRYIKLRKETDSQFVPILSSVSRSKYLDLLISHLSSPTSLEEIYALLSSQLAEDGVSRQNFIEFAKTLFDEQILTCDHMYSLDGANCSYELRNLYPDTFESIDKTIGLLSQGAVSFPDAFSAIKSIVSEKIPSPPNKNYVRLDSYRCLDENSGIPSDFLIELKKSVHAILHQYVAKEGPFEELLDRWDERFGDADIPLLHLVDETFGIYSPISNNETRIFSSLPSVRPRTTKRKRHLESIHRQLNCKNGSSIHVALEDLIESQSVSEIEPESVVVWCRFWKDPLGNNVPELMLLGFSDIGRLFGRFSSYCAQFSRMIYQYNSSYGGEDTISVELVAHQRSRVANVCMRTKLSDYEITIRTASSEGAESLPLDDIVVCKVDGKLRLRSISKNKWIKLSFSSAFYHKHKSTLKLYRFLVDIVGQDDFESAPLTPRKISSNLIYAPRLFIGKVLIEKASWKIGGEQRRILLKATTIADFKSLLWGFIDKYEIPPLVEIAEGDNKLLLDLRINSCLSIFKHLLLKNEELLMYEFSPPGYSLALKGSSGKFNHECIVGYTAKTNIKKIDLSNRYILRSNSSVYRPGSEWIYLKVYVQPIFQNQVLSRLHDLLAEKNFCDFIDVFFFVRYLDKNGPHLRIRIKVHQGMQSSILFESLSACINKIGVSKIMDYSFCTYAPERNRYGGHVAMSTCWKLFDLSSRFVISENKSSIGVIESAIWFINTLFDAFGIVGIKEKLSICRDSAKAFNAEYVFTDEIRNSTLDKLKKIRTLNEINASPIHLNALADNIHSLTSRLIELDKECSLSESIRSIFGSMAHMHLNRTFTENPRAHEAIFWDLMRRYYGIQMSLEERSLELR